MAGCSLSALFSTCDGFFRCQPQAECHFKVDRSSRWVTSGGVWTWLYRGWGCWHEQHIWQNLKGSEKVSCYVKVCVSESGTKAKNKKIFTDRHVLQIQWNEGGVCCCLPAEVAECVLWFDASVCSYMVCKCISNLLKTTLTTNVAWHLQIFSRCDTAPWRFGSRNKQSHLWFNST